MFSFAASLFLAGALLFTGAFAETLRYETLEEVLIMCQDRDVPVESCGRYLYRLNDNSCVSITLYGMTFPEAQDLCHEDDGRVVTLANENEFRKLLCIVATAIPRRLPYWVGAIRKGDDFVWLDGSGIIPPDAPWQHNQPDNFGGSENCVWMNSFNWGQLNDKPCDIRTPVVCQYWA
ncbi:C-type isolectin Sp-CL4-like [Syngnathus scovelli]|uniref:C-type isolectin Sp-CL4-like n=1 Tax=Syngnathus scovelli TaxID=161590 RepID=UPI0021108ECE|nr:C-type lectin domain family 4 member G-like [Syngnathus scovelli]